MFQLALSLCYILFLVCSLNAKNSVVIETKLGKIEGFLDENDGFPVETYLGIKYGEVLQRFAKPTSVKPWSGLISAKHMPSRCHQVKVSGDDNQIRNTRITMDTEDCLFLNLFAPHEKDPDGHPVMVFIHGGRWTEGSSFEYGLEGIKQWIVPKGVIFIIFHYRLGPWGFFSTGTNEAPGNWGLWDQVLLLQWVHDNVAAFGGDPNKVTLFGQSAGAMATSFHTVSPHSRHLFNNAILMSGSSLFPFTAHDRTVEESYKLAEILGCHQQKPSEMLNCMRRIPIEELKNAFVKTYISGSVNFIPVVDHDFLPGNLEDLLKRSPPKSIIIGVTKQEMGIYVTPPHEKLTSLFEIQDPTKFHVQEFRQRIKDYLLFRKFNNVDLLTQICLYHYVDSLGYRHNSSLLTQAYIQFLGDDMFNAPAYQEANVRRQNGSKVWFYSFDYFNKELATGSFHWFDLWYLFKFTLFRYANFTKEEEKVAHYYTTLFTNFAKFGNPTHSKIDGITWLPITSDKPDSYLNINEKLEFGNYWNRKGAKLWNELLPNVEQSLVAKSRNVDAEKV